MPCNSVTLALPEILQSLAIDTFLVSRGQHRKAVGLERSFLDNHNRVSPANNMQYMDGTCTKEHPNIPVQRPIEPLCIKSDKDANSILIWLKTFGYDRDIMGLCRWHPNIPVHRSTQAYLYKGARKHTCITLSNNNTERTQSTYLNNDYCLKFVFLIFWYHY